MLILKQNAANTVPTPPAGKGTIFLDDSDVLSVKTSDGNVETFPTVGASNAQVVFMNGTSLSGEAAFTYDFNNNVLSVSGNVAATRVLTDNLLYANGTAWDLQQPGGSNTQIQFNDADSFGGSAALTFNKSSNLVSMGGGLSVTGNANVGNIGATNGVFTNVSGNGASLSAITGANVSGAVAFATTANAVAGANVSGAVAFATTANAVAGANVTGTVANATHSSTANTVVDAAQPNITSVGTLSSLSVTGNANVGNIGAASGVFTNVSGNGSALSSLTGGNVTGAVAFATTANAVAGANVSGEVGFAAVANSVAGANVSGQVANALVAGTVYTAAQPNITSVGTLSGLSVDGSNITLANGVYVGNGAGLTALAGANVTGTVANATHASTANTVVDAAQPNITSVGTLSSLTVSGNAGANNFNATTHVTAGNVWANSGTIGASLLTGTLTTAAQPNVTSVGTLSSLSVTGNVAAGNLTTTGVLSVTGTGVSSIAGNLDMTSNTIINLANPTNDQDAATKIYVDNIAQGLHVHAPSAAATPDTLANVTGGTITYNNGTAGVGANLVTTGSFNLIDGVNVQTSGTRILVKNEANTAHNGIYTWANSTTIVRATDFDTPTEMAGGDFTFVSGGATYNDTGWVMPDPVTTVGTSAVTFVQFSGAGTYTAGTGLTLTGSVFSVNASQTQVTALGTVTSGTWNSIVGSSATFAAGLSGANLASLNASNISSGTLDQARLANASLTVNGQSISLGGSGTITANTTQTLTLGGFLTGTSFNGGTAVTAAVDATSANTASKVVARDASGNFSAGTITATLSGAATTAGTVTTAAQPNITSVGTLSSLSVTGNISAGNVSATTFTGALSGAATTAGTVTTAAQPNITSVGTLTGLTVSSTITGSVSGSAGTAGTVTTAAQPNITSVGTLTSLSVSGGITNANITTGANTTAGSLTGNWTLTAGSRLQATYADLAEKYVSDASYPAGTVLLFGGDHEVTISNVTDSHSVAGVVSTNPAYIMNSGCQGEHVVDLALQGRVPVKVQGHVRKGDLMVSGMNGHAVANNLARAGTIIGKALQNFSGDHGVIEIVVGRV